MGRWVAIVIKIKGLPVPMQAPSISSGPQGIPMSTRSSGTSAQYVGEEYRRPVSACYPDDPAGILGLRSRGFDTAVYEEQPDKILDPAP